MDKPFQRKGAKSNAHVGREFEVKIQQYFAQIFGLFLKTSISVPIGINGQKIHSFDLGNAEQKILVECKAHTWTEGGNVPSAKLTVWNEAMYFFYAAPSDYKKIFFVLRDYNQKKKETLGQYYIRTNAHLIPAGIEFWEFDEAHNTAEKIN